jgi:hypothetical protein
MCVELDCVTVESGLVNADKFRFGVRSRPSW